MNARHILRSQQFDKTALEKLFASADELGKLISTPEGEADARKILQGRRLFAVFYEPSTRTRFSFCSAAKHLGMDTVQTENAAEFSSAIKGESLEDSIRALCELRPHVIILRHKSDGAAERAAEVVNRWKYPVSIVNAGDGTLQHPTQALLDLYTIQRHFGRLDNLTVTIGGDLLNGRTGRSLTYLLAKYEGTRLIFLSPPSLRMKPDILDHLREHAVPFEETGNLDAALEKADVAYWTRVQKERGSASDPEVSLSIGLEQMARMKPGSILMHPLPRVDEIAREVDQDPRAVYFQQVGNGLLIRMALLRDICS